MINLVTLAHAKSHLHVVDTDHDADIQFRIRQASEIIMDYLKLTEPPDAWELDEDGVQTSPVVYTVPALHQAACLLVLSELYENRESSTSDPLTDAVKNLLHRQRDPAMG